MNTDLYILQQFQFLWIIDLICRPPYLICHHRAQNIPTYISLVQCLLTTYLPTPQIIIIIHNHTIIMVIRISTTKRNKNINIWPLKVVSYNEYQPFFYTVDVVLWVVTPCDLLRCFGITYRLYF